MTDDNEATCTLIVALLRSEFDVEVAADGQDALDKLATRQYAAVVLDLLMPVVDGYAVLDHLVRERREILPRVLVVTASVSERTMERLRQYPVQKVLPKPFNIEVLQQLVRQCASARDPQQPEGTSGTAIVCAILTQVL